MLCCAALHGVHQVGHAEKRCSSGRSVLKQRWNDGVNDGVEQRSARSVHRYLPHGTVR